MRKGSYFSKRMTTSNIILIDVCGNFENAENNSDLEKFSGSEKELKRLHFVNPLYFPRDVNKKISSFPKNSNF